MNSNCEIISYTLNNDFNEDTFKGLNILTDEIQNINIFDDIFKNKITNYNYIIFKNNICYITHTNYIEINKIEGLINVNLINYPTNINEQSDEYISYFIDIKNFIFEQLNIKKEKKLTYIIRDLDTNKIIITDGYYITIF